MCNVEYMRTVMKIFTVSGVKATVPDPASVTHQDGLWLATDIYVGEWAFNSADGIWFTRDKNDNILESKMQPSARNPKVAKLLLSQSGISAPSETQLVNDLGGNIVWTRITKGRYNGALSGAFPSGKTFLVPGSGTSGIHNVQVFRVDDNNIEVATQIIGTGVDDNVLNQTAILIEVYP